MFNGKEYKIDTLVWSTGFTLGRGGPDSRGMLTVTGRNGLTMTDKFTNNVGTLHGVVSRDFPNFFFPGPNQAGVTANQAYVLDLLSEHISWIISQAQKKADGGKKVTIEPTAEAEQAWSLQIAMQASAMAAMSGCTPSYLNNEGEADKIRTAPPEVQMKAARNSVWAKGIADYKKTIEAWRSQGDLEGLDVNVA